MHHHTVYFFFLFRSTTKRTMFEKEEECENHYNECGPSMQIKKYFIKEFCVNVMSFFLFMFSNVYIYYMGSACNRERRNIEKGEGLGRSQGEVYVTDTYVMGL
ncbi:hypothetical protein BCR42DRAFT_430075, partial [Absidia repens]